MSSLPPNLVGPILQSHLAQRQVSHVRDNERVQQSTFNRQQTNAIDEQDSTVETDDGDTQVHADAEGTGSQGRAFSEGEQPETPAVETDAADDQQEGLHIDLQA